MDSVTPLGSLSEAIPLNWLTCALAPDLQGLTDGQVSPGQPLLSSSCSPWGQRGSHNQTLRTKGKFLLIALLLLQASSPAGAQLEPGGGWLVLGSFPTAGWIYLCLKAPSLSPPLPCSLPQGNHSKRA